MTDFKSFGKIYRLSREMIITEKIDGTNAQITITENGDFLCGSRNRFITPDDDNYGFAKWAYDNKEELTKLGVGTHYGEWWGSDIQRGYGLTKGERRFSLFNVSRWNDTNKPSCCEVVPVLYCGLFDTEIIYDCMEKLKQTGSLASYGFMRPEGIVIFHTQSGYLFKKTFENDEKGKEKYCEEVSF